VTLWRQIHCSVASEAAAWRRCDPGSGRRLWPCCSGRAVVCQKSPLVRHSVVHCSSPAWKRRCCTRLSGRRRQSVDCARGAERECGSCRPLQRFLRDSQANRRLESMVTPSDLSFDATGRVLPVTSTVAMLAADRVLPATSTVAMLAADRMLSLFICSLERQTYVTVCDSKCCK